MQASVGEPGHRQGKRVYSLGDLADQEARPCPLDPSDPLGGEKAGKRVSTGSNPTGHTLPPTLIAQENPTPSQWGNWEVRRKKISYSHKFTAC